MDKIIISDRQQIHHIRDVLRFKPNAIVTVFDNSGNEYVAKIEKITSLKVTLNIIERHLFVSNNMRITVACAILKKSQFDDIVDKLTQLGIDRIIPLQTERVIVRWDENKKISCLRRWKKIALSATQQSQRNSLPVLEAVRDIKEVLNTAENFDLKLIPTLSGKRKTLKEIFAQTKAKNILILIGPEGDFTPQEIELAKSKGFIPVSLGDLVLRVDTAAVAVVSFIRLYTGTVPEGDCP